MPSTPRWTSSGSRRSSPPPSGARSPNQIRRSSRSVAANVAEAWRKRRYEAAFVSKLSDSETEAAETQVWLEFAVKCGYVERARAAKLYSEYEQLIAMLVAMIRDADKWIIREPRVSLSK